LRGTTPNRDDEKISGREINKNKYKIVNKIIVLSLTRKYK